MKSIVITGSTRGIGFGLASAFLSRGCAVTVSSRNQYSVKKALDSLARKHSNDRFLGVVCDVRDFHQIQALWDEAHERFGSINIWINNAGFISSVGELWEFDPASVKAMVETNLLGTVYGAMVAVERMLAQGQGAIYNMEGMGSDGRKHEGLAYYGMTKYGLRYFTEALANETKGTPLIIGGLSPGMVITDLIIDQYQGRPEDFERVKGIFNIIADTVDNVTPWMATKILENNKSGVRIKYLTRSKMIYRFLSAPFTKRDLFSGIDIK